MLLLLLVWLQSLPFSRDEESMIKSTLFDLPPDDVVSTTDSHPPSPPPEMGNGKCVGLYLWSIKKYYDEDFLENHSFPLALKIIFKLLMVVHFVKENTNPRLSHNCHRRPIDPQWNIPRNTRWFWFWFFIRIDWYSNSLLWLFKKWHVIGIAWIPTSDN